MCNFAGEGMCKKLINELNAKELKLNTLNLNHYSDLKLKVNFCGN